MDERSSYDRTRERLEEIVTQVKAKDVPLEKSLELYEEALRLGNVCAEMIDRTDFSAEEIERAGAPLDEEAEAGEGTDEEAEADGETVVLPSEEDGDEDEGFEGEEIAEGTDEDEDDEDGDDGDEGLGDEEADE
jgi:exodeoxyribonuclease VII small subunit